MENVHGISVAGGTFPAEIWRRFMQSALDGVPALGWVQPKQWPTYVSWSGEWQYGGAPYYDSGDDDDSGDYSEPATTAEEQPTPAPEPKPKPEPAKPKPTPSPPAPPPPPPPPSEPPPAGSDVP